jgi:hypothetical protein
MQLLASLESLEENSGLFSLKAFAFRARLTGLQGYKQSYCYADGRI